MDDKLDFFIDIQGLKKVKRCAPYHKAFHESVADHSYQMVVLAVNLMSQLKLDLDYEKVIKLCLYHDLCELGLENDFDSYASHINKEISKSKKQYERDTITKLASKHNFQEILTYHSEYEQQKTEEAKFVRALDKLEGVLHIIAIPSGKITNPKWLAIYCHDAVAQFPKLIPFYLQVEQRLKTRIEQCGFEWVAEYNFKNDRKI